ncbi:MAG: FAD-dependent oxidoreductase, partial [Chloroflexi bacterium]|nr:FAD-dependent oxidoreductase [Chloroflexota bacterium]
EYEKIGWWEFIGANNRSEEYQKLFGIGCTRSVVAAQARRASSKTIGDMFVQYFFNIAEPTVNADRVLNGPTNDVWLGPWLDYLRSRGVEYHLDSRVRSIELRGGLVRGVTVERDRTVVQEHADYYVAALPVEVMATLITDEMVRVDPSLANIFALSRNVGWMNGIQFYLSDDVPISRGHTIYLDSPWALTSISQRQFWPGVDLRRYGDGRIRGILSVDISDWDTPGLFGKPARQCTREEVKNEVWEQLKRSLNVTGTTLLSDDNLRDWFLDPDVNPILGTNSEPLLVNLVDTWRLRPTATTRIRNFFLASDYVQTFTDLATMEGANEAGRRAVNGILEACGVTASPCQIWNLHEPELLQAWRAHDLNRYRRGLPWEDTLMSLAMNALAAVQRGALALESSIRNGVGSAAHVEDLLSYLRTGESRSALLERLTSGRDEQAGGDLLRAFAALSRAGTPQSDALSTAAVDALASLSREVSGVRFVES